MENENLTNGDQGNDIEESGQGPQINTDAWRQKYQDLPFMHFERVSDKISKNALIQGYKLSCLHWDQADINQEIQIKDCRIEGVRARGANFAKKVTFQNCLFTDRVQLSAQKSESEFTKTCFNQELEFIDCVFDETFTIRNSMVHGNFTFQGCHIEKPLALDKSTFHNEVIFNGPGNMAVATMYRTKFKQDLTIRDYEISGLEEKSLDLNRAEMAGTFSLINCCLSNLEMEKAQLGSAANDAWIVERCSWQHLYLNETNFLGRVQLVQVKCKGKLIAEVERDKSGKRLGKVTQFLEDAAFIEVTFGGKCSFHGARFKKYANFTRCTFRKGGDFNQAEFGQLASFWQSEAYGSLSFRKALFSGRTQFGQVTFAPKSSFNESNFEEEFHFFDNQVKGDIFFSRAYYKKDFKLRGVQFEGGLGLEKIVVDGNLSITQCSTQDRFILSQCQLQGGLTAPGFSIGTWGTMAQCVIKGEVDLGGLKVGAKIEPTTPLPIDNNSGEDPADAVVPRLFLYG